MSYCKSIVVQFKISDWFHGCVSLFGVILLKLSSQIGECSEAISFEFLTENITYPRGAGSVSSFLLI